MKPRAQVEASAAAMDAALEAGLTVEQLVKVVVARADQREAGLPANLADPEVLEAHLHPAAKLVDETHIARSIGTRRTPGQARPRTS